VELELGEAVAIPVPVEEAGPGGGDWQPTVARVTAAATISHGARAMGFRAGAGVIFRFIFSGFLDDRPRGNRQSANRDRPCRFRRRKPATAATPTWTVGTMPARQVLELFHNRYGTATINPSHIAVKSPFEAPASLTLLVSHYERANLAWKTHRKLPVAAG